MAEFRTRVRRVRMKSGGADVRVLSNQKAVEGDEDWRGAVVRNARDLAEMAGEDKPLAGYLLVGMFEDGSTSLSFRYDYDRAPMPRMMIPSWLAEVVRRDIITADESRDTFNEMFQWVDG